MNLEEQYRETLNRIISENDAYSPRAYDFVRQAVSYTADRMYCSADDPPLRRHMEGGQLLDGIRDLAIEEFGPMAMTVFGEWGITGTEDFGAIVFLLVKYRLLGASEEDSPEDFSNGFDFAETFLKPYREEGDLPDDLPSLD